MFAIYFVRSPPSRLRPSFHLLRRLQRGCTPEDLSAAHTEIQASSCTHEHPRFRACLARHSIPLGHFRPGQAPPTFILITSWFVPASVPRLPSRWAIFSRRRLGTTPLPLAYSCPSATNFTHPHPTYTWEAWRLRCKRALHLRRWQRNCEL